MSRDQLSVGEIAHVCHEANRALQKILGDASPSPHWEHAPADQRRSSRHGVSAAMAGATPEQLHAEWCRFKDSEGWVWGPEKDPLGKTHPCMVPYAELPPEQRLKDALFHAIVRTLSSHAAANTSMVGLLAAMIGQSPSALAELAADISIGAGALPEPAVDTSDAAAEVDGLTGLLERASDALTEALGPDDLREHENRSFAMENGLVRAIKVLAFQRDQARKAAEVADTRTDQITDRHIAAQRRITELEIELQEARS